jgi:hypothetical protein
MTRNDGEVILFWTLPVVLLIWASVFFLFPGFLPPMSPATSAEEVAGFYRDPANLPRIRYSMILFNWFCVGLVPLLMLIASQIRRMAHRTPIFAYSIIACAAYAPTTFMMSSLFWLLAAFRPERDPQLILLFNDLAWVSSAPQAGCLIASCVLLALAIFLDRQPRPVFPRWVAHFNLGIAVLLVPACFVALAMEGPLAWDGVLGFWARNLAIGLWIAVMASVLGRVIHRRRSEEALPA